jgi:hypothetical protein
MTTLEQRKAAEPQGVIVLRGEYTVDGGAVKDEALGCIELSGEHVDGLHCQAVTLFVRRDELGFYPIGSPVRITVERLPDAYAPNPVKKLSWAEKRKVAVAMYAECMDIRVVCKTFGIERSTAKRWLRAGRAW